MSAKYLRFEKAFLSRQWAGNRAGENPLPQILRDADVKSAGKARAAGLPGTGMRLPPRIMVRRKRTGR